MRPCVDMWDHWRASHDIAHPVRTCPVLEPGLEATFETYSKCWMHLNDLRQAVVQEVRDMIDEWQDVTSDWFGSLPIGIQSVYTCNGAKVVTQVPVMMELLRLTGHGGHVILMKELTEGFNMTGTLSPGTGWLPRLDGRYASPISAHEFHMNNRRYVQDKLKNARPSPHWQVMLDELMEETRKGRVEGPLQAPPSWGATLPPYGDIPLKAAPTDEAWAAMCFAVVQSDKVRRCEDYRRSSHNSTVEAGDTPHYHDIECYISMIRRLKTMDQGNPEIWGQDMAGAYRQLPVKPGDDTYTILMLPQGPSLWRHRAAPFGAVASVWAFCRFGDAVTSLARRLLVILNGHFVDDWTGIELPATVQSSCEAFKTFFQLLGLDMKPEKEQLPAGSQKVLGVIIKVKDENLVVEICPKRRERLLQALDKILHENMLTPDDAQHVSGKLGFMTTTLFGGMGAAAIQPFYARAHSLGEQKNNKLTFALRAAIHTLMQLLKTSRPRTIPWTSHDECVQAVVYSDAFFQLGERKLRPDQAPELWTPSKRKPSANGWGFIVRTPNKVVYAHGELPLAFIQRFTQRRAFIYMMEVLAAVMAVVFLQEELPPYFVMFVDNQAGRCALQKGYGNDARVNAIITAFWALVSHKMWYPVFKYVPSALNISDPISRHDTSQAQQAGWTEYHVPWADFLVILESFAADPDGSIQALLSSLLALRGTPSEVEVVHGVVGSVHNQPCTSGPNLPPS